MCQYFQKHPVVGNTPVERGLISWRVSRIGHRPTVLARVSPMSARRLSVTDRGHHLLAIVHPTSAGEPPASVRRPPLSARGPSVWILYPHVYPVVWILARAPVSLTWPPGSYIGLSDPRISQRESLCISQWVSCVFQKASCVSRRTSYAD